MARCYFGDDHVWIRFGGSVVFPCPCSWGQNSFTVPRWTPTCKPIRTSVSRAVETNAEQPQLSLVWFCPGTLVTPRFLLLSPHVRSVSLLSLLFEGKNAQILKWLNKIKQKRTNINIYQANAPKNLSCAEIISLLLFFFCVWPIHFLFILMLLLFFIANIFMKHSCHNSAAVPKWTKLLKKSSRI